MPNTDSQFVDAWKQSLPIRKDTLAYAWILQSSAVDRH